MFSKMFCVLSFSIALTSCNSIQQYSFQPTAGQMGLNRDGVAGIVSKRSRSVVLVSNARKGPAAGYRRVVVGIQNISNTPLNFELSAVEIFETRSGEIVRPLTVVTYDRLVNEEKTRQVIGAILLGVAAGANSYSASQAGYGTARGTVNTTTYGRYGTYNSQSNVSINYFDPGVNMAAQANAAAQNSAMISNASVNNEQTLVALEQSVIKDNTLLPNELYGGQLFFEVPGSPSDLKEFLIQLRVGSDTHQFRVRSAS